MGIGKTLGKIFLQGGDDELLPDEADEKVEPTKPTKSQFTHITPQQSINNVVQQPVQQQTYYGGLISEEDKEKWTKYFSDLFAKLNDPKPSYHEFIALAESLPTSLNDQERFISAYKGMKGLGLTKLLLLDTAKSTLNAIKENTTKFSTDNQKLIDSEVTSKKKGIEDRQSQILKLQQEIQRVQQEVSQMTIEAQQAETKLQNRAFAYNTFSGELLSKIQRDIQMIETSIQ